MYLQYQLKLGNNTNGHKVDKLKWIFYKLTNAIPLGSIEKTCAHNLAKISRELAPYSKCILLGNGNS